MNDETRQALLAHVQMYERNIQSADLAVQEAESRLSVARQERDQLVARITAIQEDLNS